MWAVPAATDAMSVRRVVVGGTTVVAATDVVVGSGIESEVSRESSAVQPTADTEMRRPRTTTMSG